MFVFGVYSSGFSAALLEHMNTGTRGVHRCLDVNIPRDISACLTIMLYSEPGNGQRRCQSEGYVTDWDDT